jgi:hypothetical protein
VASYKNVVPAGDKTIEWIDEQIRVITQPPDARVLVSAGPGTGKTAVTCARIARLISECEIEPGKIWLVSFTRTAVHELRQRIASFLGDNRIAAAGMRIATLDAHAWAIHSGFDGEASLTGSYEENIKKVIDLFKKHEGVAEYLSSVRHVFVDEAQDVIGVRCELVLELINALPQNCGVTVLADEAQSIYDFSEDEAVGNVKGSLPEKIREYLGFKEFQLTEIHRTDDPTLIELFGKGRGIILKGALGGKARLEKIRAFLEKTNHGDAGQYREDLKNLAHDVDHAFLLFRKRGEAYEASSHLGSRPHRLRMSGLPVVIHPWIGQILWDWTAVEMGIAEFERRWKDRVKGVQSACEAAWKGLVRTCGISDRTIAVQKLASRLARGSAPMDLCHPDFGSAGPVVGTIHAAKGREAAEVRLYLPPHRDIPDAKADEEARVLFVGATRAMKTLHIGRGQSRVFARRTASGRAYTPYAFGNDNKAFMEVGRHEDLNAEGLVGRQLFQSENAARSAQARVMDLAGSITTDLVAKADPGLEWRYAVRHGEELVCYLSKRVNTDLFEVARQVDAMIHRQGSKPLPELRHLRSFGVRTIAIAADDPARQALHSPWRDSGFVLAPLITGYSLAYYRR